MQTIFDMIVLASDTVASIDFLRERQILGAIELQGIVAIAFAPHHPCNHIIQMK